MKRWILQLGLGALVVGGQFAHATEVSLADWCVNFNGDTSTACNGAGGGGASGTGSISLASFDTSLEPGSNGLGSVTVTVGSGSSQYASFYADYDVDYATQGSFQDSISVVGAVPAGVTYEAGDAEASNIFADFAAGNLLNTNTVPTAAGPDPGPVCCDAEFAIAVGGINQTGTVTFNVSDVAPDGGFYLQQTNLNTGNSIYLSVATDFASGTPEPSTFGLGLIGLAVAALGFFRRKRVLLNG
jgi:hypothetical protein